jgi:curli production assembly/transport component CsgG/holdfast attachment protein HfaB
MKINKKSKMMSAIALAAVSATACVSPYAGPQGFYAQPIGNAPVTSNPTPYTGALVCLGQYARANNLATPRIAVGRISDYTGKAELEGGRKVTQGASLMAISALAKAGAQLVERYDTSVAELELKYANNKLIGDAEPGFRKIKAGSIPGSDFYMVGGITELNYNIRSAGFDGFGGDRDVEDPKGFINGNLFVMNIGLDMRLVQTQTLEVADVISYQKQIIGREIGGGYFDFFNNNVIDISAGEKAIEPMQLAVRTVVERAVLEMMANVYGVSGSEVCSFNDPLATNGGTGDFTPAYDNLETNNGNSREDPNRWHDSRDRNVGLWLRGSY